MKECENPECGNEVRGRFSTAKYCCEDCRLAVAYQRKLERLGTRACDCCGKEYQVTQKGSKYCQSCAAKKRGPTRNRKYRDKDVIAPDVVMRNKFLLMPR